MLCHIIAAARGTGMSRLSLETGYRVERFSFVHGRHGIIREQWRDFERIASYQMGLCVSESRL
jgi:hypothetical protein